MLVIFVRTFILYSVVVLTMRLMGKRQIGQLEPFELVIAIMIAELATIPMEDRGIPLINGLVPIMTLLFIQVLISFLSLKSLWFRSIMDGSPSIVVRNGKIQEKELYNARFNLNELIEQLRTKGYANISDVEYAILETSGDLSVIPKSQKRAVTPGDLKIDTQYEGLPIPLVIDGLIQTKNLNMVNLDESWLKLELQKFGIDRPDDVLIASLDTQGKLYFQSRDHKK